MATGSRSLILKLLADTDNFKKGLTGAENDVQSFGDRIGKFGKIAGAAFLAAGAAATAYAGKLLVDGVKSAIEDDKAQQKLATTLRNVTGATDAQIASVEKQILKTELLTGKTDDELRPSFERLVRSTKDSSEALKLQAVALDISAGTGKSLEAVSNALAKAHDGQTTALGKLGVGLSAAELKSMSFDEITKKLSTTFEGQANVQANTFAGKMERLKVAFAEGKETIGSYILTAITPMVSGIVNDVIPAISNFADSLGKNLGPAFDNISKFITENLLPIFNEWWKFFTETVIPGIIKTVSPILEGLGNLFGDIADAIKKNKDKLEPLFELFKEVGKFIIKTLGPILGETLGGALTAVGEIVKVLIGLFAGFIGKLQSIWEKVKALIDLIRSGWSFITGGGGGSVSAASPIPTPSVFGQNTGPSNIRTSGTTNITINGAIDSESTAKQVIQLLNDSAARGGVANSANWRFV